MITDAILNALFSLLTALIGLLPNLSFPWESATFGPMMAFANSVFPLAEFFGIMRTLASLGVGLGVLWAVMKVIDWMPFT